MAPMGAHTEQSTLAACIATIIGAAPGDVPLDEDDRRAWLGERRVGLVPVQDAGDFAWPGPWIAWRAARDGSGRRAVVMFGVPSGPIWDPAGTGDDVLGGLVVAPLDIAVWDAPSARDPGTGIVEAIVVGPAAAGPLAPTREAAAIPGRGLAGDRYADSAGTFASGRPGSALTLVDAAVLDELAAAQGAPIDHRRNVVVRGADLNALVGRRFTLGDVLCEGRRLCEPCAHLERLNGGGVLRPLVHRGGLRADIVGGGTVRVGDELVPV
jgi:MOSC domain-containing protein YiiM